MFNRRGSSLLIVLLIGTILSGLLVSVGASTMFHLRSTTLSEKKAQQELAARAGLHHALVLLQTDKARTATLTDTLNNGFQYEVTFVNNEDGSLGSNHKAADGTPVAPGHVYMKSVGSETGATTGGATSYAAQAWQPPVTVNTAAFGDKTVAIVDSDVTHWGSTSSPPAEFKPPGQIMSMSMSAEAAMGMAADRRPPTMEVSAKFTKALLGTNSSSMESLWAEGSSTIRGNVAYGEGSAVAAKSGVVSVIGADASTAQDDGGLSPFAPSKGPDDETPRVPGTVDFRGDVEVFSNSVPFPQRPEMSGSGFDETFAGPVVEVAVIEPLTPLTAMSSDEPVIFVTPEVPEEFSTSGVNPDSFAIEQAQDETILSPGRYGKLEFQPGAIVKLEAGVYEVDEIAMEGATLLVDQSAASAVVLTVKDRFEAVDSDINRYKHAATAYDSNLFWSPSDLDAQSGNPSKLEIYFQGERVSASSTTIEKSEFDLRDSFVSAASVGKKVDATVNGGAVHGAFLADNLLLDSTKVYHAKAFQNSNKAISSKGPWTLKNTNRVGKTDTGGTLEENDPWKAIEDAWTAQSL